MYSDYTLSLCTFAGSCVMLTWCCTETGGTTSTRSTCWKGTSGTPPTSWSPRPSTTGATSRTTSSACSPCLDWSVAPETVEDHFALRPQKRGGLLGTGRGWGVGGGEGDERMKARPRIPPEKDRRDRGPPPEQWKC